MWKLLSRAGSPGGPRGNLTVLFFHRVLPAHDPLLPDEPTPPQFAAMLRWLQGQHTLLPLPEALRRMETRSLPAAAAAITFDDGYRDNLEVAAPLLQRQGVPATFFIATDFLDGGLMWNDLIIESLRNATVSVLDLPALGMEPLPIGDTAQRRAAVVSVLNKLKYLPYVDRQQAVDQVAQACRPSSMPNLMMDRNRVRRLQAMGFDIGAHTCSHPILTQLPDAEAEREIRVSRDVLEATLDAEVALFAYPNGRTEMDFDRRHVAMARRAGYSAAFTTDAGVCDHAADRWRLPRFTPWDHTEMRFRLQLLRNQWRRLPTTRAQA
jgi:peptidoglycan/xylan/chitin deacetylase (PgdA/CDA1 family)